VHGGQSARIQLTKCSSCSCELVFRSVESVVFVCKEFCGWFARRVWTVPPSRTVRTRARTVHFSGCATGGSKAIFGQSAAISQTVLPGLAQSMRIVRPRPRRSAKSFASRVAHSLGICLRLVPMVGRSVLSARPWQVRVRIIGCEFGT
jgi:hypothetical protein